MTPEERARGKIRPGVLFQPHELEQDAESEVLQAVRAGLRVHVDRSESKQEGRKSLSWRVKPQSEVMAASEGRARVGFLCQRGNAYPEAMLACQLGET